MTKKQDYSIERMVDRAQIQDVMYRWCRAIDRRDPDSVRDLFHPDATDNHGPYKGDVEGLIAWLKERHKAIPFSMHLTGNTLIEFAGPDVALVETYAFAIQRYPDEVKKAAMAQLTGGAEGKPGVSMDVMFCARYVDRFERRLGEWRIAERTSVFDSTMMFEVPPDAPKFDNPGWAVGRRDAQDPVYQARRALGLA